MISEKPSRLKHYAKEYAHIVGNVLERIYIWSMASLAALIQSNEHELEQQQQWQLSTQHFYN
jgi:hypothetical protein